MSDRRVLITGLGPVSVAGVGPEAMAAGLSRPADALAESVGELNLAASLASAKTYLDRNSQLGLLAASLALEEAGLRPIPQGLEVGVSFGTAWGNVRTEEMFLRALAEKGPRLASPLLFIHSYPNTTSSLMAIEWGLSGRALNFCTGRSAGAEAILAAASAVADGAAQAMLAGAAEAVDGLTATPGFREAAGMMVLESPASASTREAVIYAELRAWTRGSAGIARDPAACVRAALSHAGLSATELDAVLLDADGAGLDPDLAEAFGTARQIDLRGYVGRTASAGAALAVITAAQALEARRLPEGLGGSQVRNILVVSSGVFDAAFVLTRFQ